jgi:hypothetical protein
VNGQHPKGLLVHNRQNYCLVNIGMPHVSAQRLVSPARNRPLDNAMQWSCSLSHTGFALEVKKIVLQIEENIFRRCFLEQEGGTSL